MGRLVIQPFFQHHFVDVGKKYHANEGEYPNGESQIDLPLFGVVAMIVFQPYYYL